ncbi:WD domain, G-beta repeat, putative [Trypanosoma equiperdum]|uniref:Uncharacterized protein n=2 Tax=Trypanozoon TaxID=39700 RepID=Q38C57_TRYB2|nr:hypothetical protein, conserved [Trypanosoma brucei brucei TREU927]EAN77613.1 hypothetical protein, conserved [Trypanosoma brucei brucei TREU927]SCU66917.1 WD domain, G-beta repeat, putative [Trypanosoma equiperdum]
MGQWLCFRGGSTEGGKECDGDELSVYSEVGEKMSREERYSNADCPDSGSSLLPGVMWSEQPVEQARFEDFGGSSCGSVFPPHRKHRDYKLFGGLFDANVSLLSLCSCEDAGMPQHILLGGEGGGIVLLNYASGEVVRRWSEAHSGDVNKLTRPLETGMFASCSRDSTVKVWDTECNEALCTLRGHRANVTSITQLLNGTFLVSGSRDNSVRLWDIIEGQEVACCDVKQNIVHFVRWVPSLGCVAQGGEDLTVRLWDVRTSSDGMKAIDLSLGFTMACIDYHPICCELSPDEGSYTLLTGHNGFNGHGAYVVEWDLRMQDRVRTFKAHNGTVRSIRSCPLAKGMPNRHYMSAADDGTVAFFSTADVDGAVEVSVDPANIHKVSGASVKCIDTSSGGDIFASTSDGAVIVCCQTQRGSEAVASLYHYRYFGASPG